MVAMSAPGNAFNADRIPNSQHAVAVRRSKGQSRNARECVASLPAHWASYRHDARHSLARAAGLDESRNIKQRRSVGINYFDSDSLIGRSSRLGQQARIHARQIRACSGTSVDADKECFVTCGAVERSWLKSNHQAECSAEIDTPQSIKTSMLLDSAAWTCSQFEVSIERLFPTHDVKTCFGTFANVGVIQDAKQVFQACRLPTVNP